ncbi:gastrula zinc finger protein XlCGF57.1-like [Thrips palmi]|uniref:Gastrula zinc finger protein XlCGF57.1-like n=1 Tax=Thrips palmi TaxID=161013 RepID=A0A6P8ZIU6_THRPL|nr:gastrula zinc finger protein XlCGF57.1-like [Thrips palmi]
MSFHSMPLFDFSKTCRLCLSQEYDLIPISTQTSDSSAVALASKITATVSLEVSESDDMPGQICGSCFQRIDQWYSFKQVCHNSFSVLRQCVKGDRKEDDNCDHSQLSVGDDVDKTGFGGLDASGLSPEEMANGNFSCQVCGKMFSRYNNKIFHEKKYHNIKPPPMKLKGEKVKEIYTCKICVRDFSRMDYLKTHEMRMHSNEKSFFCDCGSGFMRRHDMIWHQSTHIKSPSPGLNPDELDTSLGCPICALPFPKIEKLNEHIELIHMDAKFQCSICLSKFFNKEELNWHQKHSLVPSVTSPQSSWSQFICNICNHSFSNINMCKSHVLRVHSSTSTMKGISCCLNFNCQGGKDDEEEKKPALGQKRRFNPDNPPFFCCCCGKEFNKGNEKRRSGGGGERGSGGKIHPCKECGKNFLTSSRLKTHMLTHTDVKPYACEVCQSKFRTLSNLLAHKKRHSADPRFVCKTCGKEFLSSSGLSRHEILHTGVKDFACDECGKTFVTLQERRKHMKYHTGEKSHTCKYCEKSFFESGHLAIHLRSHLNEKPYSCVICSRSFDSTTKLKRHKKTDAHLRRMNVNQPAKETSRPEWPANNYYQEALNGGPTIYHI